MAERLSKFMVFSRLGSKLILFFIVLASVPLLVLGGLVLYLLNLSHRQDISNLELQLIDQKIEEMEKFLADTLDTLELQVGVTETTQIQSSKIPWQEQLIGGVLKANSVFEEVSFINPQGKETAKRFRHGAVPELLNVSRLQKFQVPMNGKPYVSDIYHTLSGHMITMAAPVRIGDQIVQVLAAEVNFTPMVRSIEASKLGVAGYIVFLDRDGALIAPRGKGFPVGISLAGFGRVKRVLTGEVLNALEPQDRYQSILSRTPVVGAGKRILRTGWILLAEWPLEDADAIIHDVRDQVTRITLVGILAILALAPLFAARIIKPIRELEQGAAEIEQGNFEKRVEIRTRDELQDLGEAFNRMSKGLKRLQELKNEFVFIAAHELRTPVTAIKGYLSMVLEGSAGAVSETLRRYINPVVQANERLIHLVNDILEIARSEAGRIKIEVFAIDIRLSVKAMLEEVKPLAAEKEITITYERPEAMMVVLTDTVRVKEIITNLISNAIKYNNKGGWIKVYHEKEGDMIVTHVEDNGFGMSPEEQKRIFEKFFRAETELTRAVQGTGLGLFITRELVEKMGGKIWFRSEQGKGTRFSFSLPVPK